MPWKNLQTLLFDPGFCPSSSFNANVGDARIYGSESTVKYQPNSFWSMQLSASYNDSRVTTALPGVGVVAPGERLPYVPYFNWSGNIRYERPIQDALRGYVQYDAEHKGDMWNDLQLNGFNGLPRVLQPGYSVMNLRFGLNQTDAHWTAELYITNLLDKSAVIYTNEGNFDLRETVNEPRVFGLRLSYRFGKAEAGEAED
jgi:outer membrane receptor protein involved in Fe transport